MHNILHDWTSCVRRLVHNEEIHFGIFASFGVDEGKGPGTVSDAR